MRSVLVVDDEESTRSFLTRLVTRKGLNALAAENGQQGLDLFREHRPEIVFLDIMLPDIHGEELFKTFKKESPATRIFFVSGSDSEIALLHAHNIVAEGFLSKPIFLDEVSRIIDSILQQPG